MIFKILLPFVFFLSIGLNSLFGQDTLSHKVFINSIGHQITVIPNSDLQTINLLESWKIPSDRSHKKEHGAKMFDLPQPVNPKALPNGSDPVLQSTMGGRTSRSPEVNFDGLTGSIAPPDPTGAAGPDHYVQAINKSYAVFDKTGSMLGGPYSLDSIFGGALGIGDPIVMYDRHADRWLISELVFPTTVKVAISQTSDPLGTYSLYSFNLPSLPDYPKLSVWWDGYYLTCINAAQNAIVFDRDKMLSGLPATAQAYQAPNAFYNEVILHLPADADGSLPPNNTPCYFFGLEDDAWAGVSQDQIKIWEMNVDWVSPGNTMITQTITLSTEPFDTDILSDSIRANIRQPGTYQRLDAIVRMFMYRAQHIRWVGYNTIMLSHVTDAGGERAGIRWYELRDANDGNWYIHQQGTYAPGISGDRFISSIAMDNQGNIGLAYSFCDSVEGIYPGLRYAGRFADDPLGQMTLVENTAISGLSPQIGENRFGDYAHMSLDPDGTTFWFTGEYMGNGGALKTRVFSFNLSEIAGIENPYYSNLSMTVNSTTSTIDITLTGLYDHSELTAELIDITGKIIYSVQVTHTHDTFHHTFLANHLPAGIYFVRVGNNAFQKTARLVKTH